MKLTGRMRLLAGAMVVAASCAAPPAKSPDSSPATNTPPKAPPPAATPPGITGDQQWDQAVLAQMERDARKLANPDGCRDAGECRTAPVGVKACGGPRDYIVYCAVATDSAALFRKLEELARLERAYNERYQIASTCDFRTAPDVALVGRSCRAAP